MQLLIGDTGIRLSICKDFVSLMVVLDMNDPGFNAALARMDSIHLHLIDEDVINHEVMECKHDNEKRIDQIRFPIADKAAEKALKGTIMRIQENVREIESSAKYVAGLAESL